MAQAGTNPLSPTTINQAATNQSVYLTDMYATVKRYLTQWQVNVGTTSTLVTVGYTDTSSIAQVVQLYNNLTTLVNVFEGNITTVPLRSIVSDLYVLRGING